MSKKNRNKAQTAPSEKPVTDPIPAAEEVIKTEEAAIESEEAVSEPVAEVEELIPADEEIIEDVQEEASKEQEKPTPVEEKPEEVKKEDPVVEQPKPVVVQKPIKEGTLKVEKRTGAVRIEIPQTEGVLKFNAIAKKYIEIMSAGRIDDEARRRAIITLSNMCNHVCMSSDPAVFDACYRFIMENRSIMLTQSVVTAGIDKYIEKSKIAKILQWYVTFQSLAESKLLHQRFTLNITTIRRLLNNDALANWLITKRG